MEKIDVAVLGATGLVGQKAVALLSQSKQFRIAEVAASDKRIGNSYQDEVVWHEKHPLTDSIGNLRCKASHELSSPYIISALPTDEAKKIEPILAKSGATVLSNAQAWRMDPEVALVIPEVNLQDLLANRGKIITNPNCSAVFIALAVAPLIEVGTVEHVSVVTMQAISGAGFSGCAAVDILGNIIPHIENEEKKIETESQKLFKNVMPYNFSMTTHVHRVPVLHGHTIALHLHFAKEVDLEKVVATYHARNQKWPGLYHLYHQLNRPQVARDVGPYDQSVHIGRLKIGGQRNVLGMVVMGNNLVRGAAGASIRNLEEICRLR